MSKNLEVKYLIKLPSSPEYSKEEMAKFYYFDFVENLDKAKSLNSIDLKTQNLNDLALADALHKIVKPFCNLCFFIGFKNLFFGPKSSVSRRLLNFFKVVTIPGAIMFYSFTTKSMIYYNYIRDDLIKTNKDEDLEKYFSFKHKYI